MLIGLTRQFVNVLWTEPVPVFKHDSLMPMLALSIMMSHAILK